MSEEVRRELKKQSFDNWQWDDPEMLILLRQMYIDLNLISKLNIDVSGSAVIKCVLILKTKSSSLYLTALFFC